MPVPYAVTGGRFVSRRPLHESIYCPECEHWFVAGTREVVERLFDEHLDEVREPELHTVEPFPSDMDAYIAEHTQQEESA